MSALITAQLSVRLFNCSKRIQGNMGVFTSLKKVFTFELKLKIFLRLPISQPCVIQME